MNEQFKLADEIIESCQSKKKVIKLSSPLNVTIQFIASPLIGIIFYFAMLSSGSTTEKPYFKVSIIGITVIAVSFISSCKYLTVYGKGTDIIVQNPFQKDIISLEDIINIEQVNILPLKQPEIKLSFNYKTKFGFSITFWPTDKYGEAKWLGIHPLVSKLKKLCENAQNQSITA